MKKPNHTLQSFTREDANLNPHTIEDVEHGYAVTFADFVFDMWLATRGRDAFARESFVARFVRDLNALPENTIANYVLPEEDVGKRKTVSNSIRYTLFSMYAAKKFIEFQKYFVAHPSASPDAEAHDNEGKTPWVLKNFTLGRNEQSDIALKVFDRLFEEGKADHLFKFGNSLDTLTEEMSKESTVYSYAAPSDAKKRAGVVKSVKTCLLISYASEKLPLLYAKIYAETADATNEEDDEGRVNRDEGEDDKDNYEKEEAAEDTNAKEETAEDTYGKEEDVEGAYEKKEDVEDTYEKDESDDDDSCASQETVVPDGRAR